MIRKIIVVLILLVFHPVGHTAVCKYIVKNEWPTGFVADIEVTNNTSSALTTWAVSWRYDDGSLVSSIWNGSLSGTNPYTASGLNWNSLVMPGQSVTIGIQGTKTATDASIPQLYGPTCSHSLPTSTPTPAPTAEPTPSPNPDIGVTIPARIEAEEYIRFDDTTEQNLGDCGSGPVDQQVTIDPAGGNCNVGWTDIGEWLEYDIDVVDEAMFDITLRLASIDTSNIIALDVDGSEVGRVNAPNAGWQSWEDRTVSNVRLGAGPHTIRVSFITGNVNVNYLQFNHATVTPTPQPTSSPPLPNGTPVSLNGQLKTCGTKLCNTNNKAIQLRGMSTHGIQWFGWGKCLTESSLDTLYEWGSDIVRITMYVQEGGYETDPTGFTAQVNRLITEVSDRGMYALIDFHSLSPGDPNGNISNAINFFTDIASINKDRINVLYEITNEPNGVSWAQIKTYADQIIPVIRAIDTTAPIIVGTPGWSSLGVSDGQNADDIINNPLVFDNILYSFHFYSASHKDNYLAELDKASNTLPIFVTEFGTQVYTGDGANDFTMGQRYIDLMRRKKISWTNWNYADDFRSGSVWNTGTCASGTWRDNELKAAGQWIKARIQNPVDDF